MSEITFLRGKMCFDLERMIKQALSYYRANCNTLISLPIAHKVVFCAMLLSISTSLGKRQAHGDTQLIKWASELPVNSLLKVS